MIAQVFTGSISFAEINDEGITLGGFGISLICCIWEDQRFAIDIGNMLAANISANIVWSGGGNIAVMVSAWSPSITVKTDKGTFTYTAHIGAAGVALQADLNGAWGLDISYGVGIGFSYHP